MGTLSYAGADYEFEDRLLAHLKIAITTKLRLKEGFLLNWQIPTDRGSGRASIWLAPDIPLAFRFGGSRPPELNRLWLDALARSSHGIRGMVVMSEDEARNYVDEAGRSTAP
ncbi:hypothetical protein ACFOYW_04800 [Gryllotalpicola reticulitermitis]|uniref:DUF7882 domain-containing protein n=1 Tax=Gryllotalpicola reticulitermitis TaxID=1184153 RepID=A0ABV8Q5P9_9MICO